MVATAIIGSAIVGGVAQATSASKAASVQKSAAAQATALQREMFNTSRDVLSPFISAGATGVNALTAAIPGLAAPIVMNQENLEATPGYQFVRAQGLKSVGNSIAARGLGASGAGIKGAAEYATGLADATYQQRFENELANKRMALESLMSPVNTGVQAAGALTGAAVDTGRSIGSNTIGAGNAAAASSIATGNAISDVGNSLVASLLAKQMFGDVNPKTGIYTKKAA